MRSVRFALCAIVLALGVVSAQVTGSISGRVTDSTGSIVPQAQVSIVDLETGQVRSVRTDERGTYRAPALPVGQYEVKAERTGFKTAVRTGIALVVAQDAVADMTLQLGDVQQQLAVNAEAPLVNVATTQISGLVGERQVKDLPLNGRSFDNLITLNPGTANTTSNRSATSTGGGQGNNFSISGNREDYNLFLLNGIEYTGVSTADVIPGGVSGQLLGVDAVREFNVLENTYGAEYGKRPGGQISLVTMSGTNQFHGSVFEFLRNSFFDARNFFDHGSVPPFKRNQFGGSAGGPIRKDKTFVFGSYEGFRQSLSLSAVAVVPDANARQGNLPASNGTLNHVGLAPGIAPYFALWPVANGPELGGGAALNYANPLQTVREDFGNLRVDHIFSQKDSLSGVYTIDDGYSTTPGTNPLQQTLSAQRAQVASLDETHVFSPAVLNVFRAGFSRAAWHLDGSPVVSDSNLIYVAGQPVGSISIGSSGLGNVGSFVGAGSNGSQQVETIHRNLFTYSDEVEIVKGKHNIKLGGWVQRVQSNDDAADQRNGVAAFADLQHFMQGQATQVLATLNPVEIGWRQTAGAWYAQDAMSLLPNLTVTVGLRHEFNNGWNSPSGLASNFVFGPNHALLTQPVVGTSVYSQNNAKALFGPRVGVAWAPFGSGSKTAIHAGFGIYYEQLDYIGSCCDAAPLNGLNQKVTVSPATFPITLAPGEPIPGAKISPSGIQPDLKMPTVQQYSIKIDQALAPNTVLSLGYVGEHGYHLLNTADVNTAIPTILPNGTKFFAPKSPRANPNLGNSRYELSNANSNYNGMHVDLTQRLKHGLQFRANYTFQKSLDNHSSSFLANSGVGGTTTILDPQNPRLDWGPSNFNITHRLAAHFSYELPIGRGKDYLSNVTGIANVLLSGWQLNGIFTAQSGFPFTPLVSFNQSGNGDSRNPDRPGLNPSFNGPIVLGNPQRWYDPAAFLLPAAGTYGNAGRDILEGPGVAEFDASLFKMFKFNERMRLQFRAEFFNFINRANFGLPIISTFTSSGAFSPSAGLINSTATTSRQIQLGLKLSW